MDLSTSVDIFRWKGNTALRSPDDIAADIIAAALARRPVGILLHHEVMAEDAMALFDDLCVALCDLGARGHTFASLLARQAGELTASVVPA